MFETVTVHLNGININKQSGKYPYRAYITKLMSYPKSAKESWMQSEGWYEDDIGKFDPSQYTSDSEGFKQRRELFMVRKEDEKDPEVYSDRFIPMFGKIYSDLNNMHCGVLPGIGINIKMEFSSDRFRIVSKAGDDLSTNWQKRPVEFSTPDLRYNISPLIVEVRPLTRSSTPQPDLEPAE